MPRYSVIVTITRDIVIDAKDEEAAEDAVQAHVDAAQTYGDRQVVEGKRAEPLYSMDKPEVAAAQEVGDDYVSGSGDPPVKGPRMPAKRVTRKELETAMRDAQKTVRHLVEREKRASRGGQVDPHLFLGRR